MKVTDPVCHMNIEKSEAAATLAYKGKTYYFCSKPCKEDFAKNPEFYLGDKTAVEEAGAKEKILFQALRAGRALSNEYVE